MSQSIINETERLNKVESVLITQARPSDDKPYTELAEKYNLKVDFRPFIEVQGLALRDVRKQKVNILDHTAVILPVATP